VGSWEGDGMGSVRCRGAVRAGPLGRGGVASPCTEHPGAPFTPERSGRPGGAGDRTAGEQGEDATRIAVSVRSAPAARRVFPGPTPGPPAAAGSAPRGARPRGPRPGDPLIRPHRVGQARVMRDRGRWRYRGKVKGMAEATRLCAKCESEAGQGRIVAGRGFPAGWPRGVIPRPRAVDLLPGPKRHRICTQGFRPHSLVRSGLRLRMRGHMPRRCLRSEPPWIADFAFPAPQLSPSSWASPSSSLPLLPSRPRRSPLPSPLPAPGLVRPSRPLPRPAGRFPRPRPPWLQPRPRTPLSTPPPTRTPSLPGIGRTRSAWRGPAILTAH
jgi:hypothetical protein